MNIAINTKDTSSLIDELVASSITRKEEGNGSAALSPKRHSRKEHTKRTASAKQVRFTVSEKFEDIYQSTKKPSEDANDDDGGFEKREKTRDSKGPKNTGADQQFIKFSKKRKHASSDDGFTEQPKKKLKSPTKHSDGGQQRKFVSSSLFSSSESHELKASHSTDLGEGLKEDLFSSGSFSDLSLHPHMISNLTNNLEMKSVTAIQARAIPAALENTDLLVKSQTGSGKTLAYAIPIIQKLQELRPKLTRKSGVLALVVVPTRELAQQTYEWFLKLVKPFTWIVPGILIGGEKKKSEKARIRKGINVLVVTPKRLLDHLEHTENLSLKDVKYLVLDEGDRILEMGYEEPVTRILSYLNKDKDEASIRDRQTILLSATLTSKVRELGSMSLQSPKFIDLLGASEGEFVTPSTLRHFYVLVPAKLRLVTLSAFILWKCKATAENKMLIFMSTQDMVDFHSDLFARILLPSNITFLRLHGEMPQKDRTDVFNQFREAQSGILLCTDVAARGLDLPAVHWIIQYTAPISAQDYIHRVGRTARLGDKGNAIIFLSPSESEFMNFMEQHHVRWRDMKADTILGRFAKIKEDNHQQSAELCATELQRKYEDAIQEDSNLHDAAAKAYQSFIRSYASYPKHLRHILSYKALHLGHYAKSFGLRDKPSELGTLANQHHDRRHQRREFSHVEERKPEREVYRRGPTSLPAIMSEFHAGVTFAPADSRKKKKKGR